MPQSLGVTHLGFRSYLTRLSIYLRPLQRHFHSLGVTNLFTPTRHSDPCLPTQAMARPVFPYLWNPHPTFPGRVHNFYGPLYPGLGIPRFQVLDPFRLQAPHQHFGAQGGNLVLYHRVSASWGHQLMIATDNTTVGAYINKLGGTHSHTLLRIVVDLFQWLQTQDIAIRARHISGGLNVIADHLSWPNQPITTEWSFHPEIVKRIFGTWGTPTVDMFATVHNTYLPQFISPILEPPTLR